MRVTLRRDGFARSERERYLPDGVNICGACGGDILRGQIVIKDQYGLICHAECVEEDEYGAE